MRQIGYVLRVISPVARHGLARIRSTCSVLHWMIILLAPRTYVVLAKGES